MSVRERLRGPANQGYSLAAFTGNFAVLQEFLLEKDGFFWGTVRLLDYLLRGFSQVVLVSNPISGLLIAISLGVTAPGTLLFSSFSGFLGLLLSMLVRDSPENIASGISAFNPLLVGAISYALIPKVYGPFDAFSVLLVILGTIFSVYLARSMMNNKSPYTAWPFNLSEFVLLFVLYTQDNGLDTEKLQPLRRMDNATSDATADDVSFIGENTTGVHIDWGMVFRGVVLSASQVFGVENVITGSVVYLATLLSSPITAGFAFLGALIGSLAGLTLNVQIKEIYSGLWGYNTFLTGASLGGAFFVLNGQSAAATVVAIVYTVIVQYVILFVTRNVITLIWLRTVYCNTYHETYAVMHLQMPVLTLPFILVASMFLQLRNDSEDRTFPQRPATPFLKNGGEDYLASHRILVQHENDASKTEEDIKGAKDMSLFNV